jgi:hypothetical protein
MAEHSPIYSAKTGQQIGHVEGNQAFDLFGRPCAMYNMDTGLLYDLNSETPVGYVSLTNIFVGSSWIAEKLFPKTEADLPPRGPLQIDDQASDAPTRRIEHADREDINVSPPIAQTPRGQQTEETGPAVTLSVVSDPGSPKGASVQELASQAVSFTPVTGLSQQNDGFGAAQLALTSPDRGSFSSDQHSRPQGASGADNFSAPADPGSDHSDDITAAPTAQPDDACLPIRAPSEYGSAVESARPDSSGVGSVPPAVEAFMRSLAAYVSLSTSQTATLAASTEGAVGPELSASSAAQKDVDQVSLQDERYTGEPDLLAAGDDLALPAAEEEAAKDQRVVEDKPVDEGETAAEDELAAKDEPVAKGDPAAEEQTAADEASSDSITATPPPITFVNPRGFESVLRDWRSDDAGDVGRESLAQSDFTPQAGSHIDETPGSAFSERDRAAQPNVCEPYDRTDQDDAQGREYFDDPPAAADDAPPSNGSQDEASGPDLALGLAKVFEVDTERAIAVARSELGSRNTVRVGADRDPTEDFFSVDIERAVRLVRDELAEAVHTADLPGPVGEADTTDPTKEVFSTEMDRVLKAVLRELEKKPR